MNNNSRVNFEYKDLDLLEDVLDAIGIDVESATKIFYKRVIKSRSIDFLFSEGENKTTQDKVSLQHPQEDRTRSAGNNIDTVRPANMKKSMAINLFRHHGIVLNRSKNITFSSKNRTTSVYWSNPMFDYLEDDWYLILHDHYNKQLHLFIIPAMSINPRNLVSRSDQTDRIDLQIMYGDPTFTDTRSGYSFLKHFKQSIKY